MSLWTPSNLVIADCPVSHRSHCDIASKFRQLKVSTPAEAVLKLFPVACPSPSSLFTFISDRTFRANYCVLF